MKRWLARSAGFNPKLGWRGSQPATDWMLQLFALIRINEPQWSAEQGRERQCWGKAKRAPGMPIRFHGTKRRYSSIDGRPSERRIASARILGRYFWPVRLFLTAFSSGQKIYCKISSFWPRRLIRPVAADVDCHTAERSTGGGSPWTPHKTMETQLKNKQMFLAFPRHRSQEPLHRQVTASHLRKVARLAELCMARARPLCPHSPCTASLGPIEAGGGAAGRGLGEVLAVGPLDWASYCTVEVGSQTGR